MACFQLKIFGTARCIFNSRRQLLFILLTLVISLSSLHSLYIYSSLIYAKSPYQRNHGDIARSCHFPQVNPFAPGIMKYLTMIKRPLNCSAKMPSLVYLDGMILRINDTKVRQTVGQIDSCRYTPLRLSNFNDNHLSDLKWSSNFSKYIKLSKMDEHLLIKCYLNDTLVGMTYKSRIVVKDGVEKERQADYERHVREHTPLETINIMIIGMDGMSKQNLVRTMPKTRDFIKKRLGAKELNKFNKVGDNTFPNVIVLHSGMHVKELPKVWNPRRYFDTIENVFLWHHYQKAGYRTAVGTDVTTGTAFHYQNRGWRRPTFDYYFRPLALQIAKDRSSRHNPANNCVGDTPEAAAIHDYILQLPSTFNNATNKPYFAYFFLTRLTHDNQGRAASGDDMYLHFFQHIEKRQILENTLVLFFSDHGSRFGRTRLTFNGRIETNTPFMFFMFPPWFGRKYPQLMKTFEQNQNRLTTFFDINKTLLKLLMFDGKKGNTSSRAISLFDEIPSDRTCLHADIPKTFCSCQFSTHRNISLKASHDMARTLMTYIRHKTVKDRKLCHVLRLHRILAVVGLNNDDNPDNFFSYEVILKTKPGMGVYQAVLNYNPQSRRAHLDGEVLRLDVYKWKSSCMQDRMLKPYCHCHKKSKQLN